MSVSLLRYLLDAALAVRQVQTAGALQHRRGYTRKRLAISFSATSVLRALAVRVTTASS